MLLLDGMALVIKMGMSFFLVSCYWSAFVSFLVETDVMRGCHWGCYNNIILVGDANLDHRKIRFDRILPCDRRGVGCYERCVQF